MREVVEVRVHGVGGGSPESLLGVSSEQTVRVAGEGPTGFWARRGQRAVEGYWWGRLTSAPALQPLWIVLLPFTLLNVAGWMHQPLDDRDRPTPWWWLVRRLLQGAAALLTALYAAWIGVLVIDLALVQWRLVGRAGSPALALAAGVAVLALYALFRIARHVQGGYEGMEPPAGVVDTSKRQEQARPGAGEARFAGERDITAATFWLHEASAQRLLLAHTVLAGLVLVVPIGVAAWRLASGDPAAVTSLGYGALVAWLLRFLVLVLIALVGATLVERRAFDHAERHSEARNDGRYAHTAPSGFRWCPQAVAATFGVGLAVGGFSGLERLLRIRIGATGSPYQDLDIAFGLAAIALVLVVAVRALVHWRVKGTQLAKLNRQADEARARGERVVSPELRTRVAWARSFTGILRNVDWLLSLPALLFLVAAIPTAVGFDGEVPGGGVIAALGGWVILAGMTTILAFLWRESRRSAVRRQVGMIWDILTFWPRRTHPFGIRPYSERAVPELQRRICEQVTGNDRAVVLSAHSQGTVLAVAALAQLVRIDPSVAGRIALVTYGSPIVALYQQFFPAYFHRALLEELHATLVAEEVGPEHAWRNFYRETDYVGKALFAGTGLAAADEVLGDPALQPDIDVWPLDRVVPGAPDTTREAFTALALHSDYNGELTLRAWVDRLGEALRRDAASNGDGPHDLSRDARPDDDAPPGHDLSRDARPDDDRPHDGSRDTPGATHSAV